MRDVSTLQMLSQYLAHPLDEDSGAAAAQALGAIGHPSTVGALTGALGSSMSGVRAAALVALRTIRSPTGTGVAAPVQPILGTLNDGSADVRRQAALTLGMIGRNGVDTSAAVQPLSTLAMNDPSAVVRKASVWALGQIKDPSARNAITHAMSDTDPFVRSIAAAALAQLH
jgi:vesicle coat complex subunit